MNMELNDDQHSLVYALSQIVRRHLAPPLDGGVSAIVHSHYSHALDRDLAEAGYFGIAREDGYGSLEAALLVEEVYRSASSVEVAASALVVPQLMGEALPRPVALMRQADLGGPARFLDVARSVLVDTGEEVAVLDIHSGDTEGVEAIYGYPFGQFRRPPDLGKARRLGPGSGARLRRWWRVALAAEAGAAMEQAVSLTVDYVKNRRQFGRPIGSFQALQHRLAIDVQLAEGTKWLARRAAWSGSESDAALAALHAQDALTTICYDCHQFHGAIGMTLEYPLHFWTYRLRALQGELGGATDQARAVCDAVWGADLTSVDAPQTAVDMRLQ
jgi:alkylation response protein AidB-like acyl-CoA dehydrogenase